MKRAIPITTGSGNCGAQEPAEPPRAATSGVACLASVPSFPPRKSQKPVAVQQTHDRRVGWGGSGNARVAGEINRLHLYHK